MEVQKVDRILYRDPNAAPAHKKKNFFGRLFGKKSKKEWRTLSPKADIAGEVFVVGAGGCGQLGLGPDILTCCKLGKLRYFDDKVIIAVAAGGQHNFALSTDGKLYSWGNNDAGALGRYAYFDKPECVPFPVEGLEHEIIVQVSCGDSFSAALTENGRVYTWGGYRDSKGIFALGDADPAKDLSPTLVDDLYYVKSISCGTNHIAATTVYGKVYTWGVNEQGQLGRNLPFGFKRRNALNPKRVRIDELKFKDAFCGGFATFLLTEDGDVYAAGLNNYGQLGIGKEGSCATIFEKVVGLPTGDPVVSISGGEHHSLMLAQSGNVYSSGRGDFFQNGLSEKALCTMSLLSNIPPSTQVSCGAYFSMVVTGDISSGDNLFMWGFGGEDQLANNGNGDNEVPLQTDLKGRIVFGAKGGGQHSLFLLKPKSI